MKVGLFIPCYINAVYPGVGRASYELLGRLGCEVDYPLGQTCCGQPMANAGFEKDARALAEHMDALFAQYDYVVGLRPAAWFSCARAIRGCWTITASMPASIRVSGRSASSSTTW